jgi:hypothetical protein
MKQIEIISSFDNDREVYSVPLSNSLQRVNIYREDYDYLTGIGCGLPWQLHLGYVAVRNERKLVSIGRILASAGEGQKVSFIDHNPFSLRKDNLFLRPGGGKIRTTEALVRSFRHNPIEVVVHAAV